MEDLFGYMGPVGHRRRGAVIPVSVRSRAHSISRSVVLVTFFFVLAVSCSSPPTPLPPPNEPPPPPRSSSLPNSCRTTVSNPGQAAPALVLAKPGDVVCFTGDRFADHTLDMTTSGTRDEPISLVADGAVMRALRVKADYVVVDGFTFADGDGLNLTGNGLVARNNVVRNATDDGIVCADCVEATLESNTVWRADGTGIVIDGDRSVVRDNIISDSVMLTSGDADGVRFFGTSLRLTNNTIRDIRTTNYPEGHAPHTDCFQTYENDDRPNYDILISGNRCENVDVQCLIATGKDTRNPPLPDWITAIVFENNMCAVSGSQAVLLEGFRNVVVRNNTFSGPLYRAVFLSRGSINCVVVGNTVQGDIKPFEIDEESSPGFHAEGNVSH